MIKRRSAFVIWHVRILTITAACSLLLLLLIDGLASAGEGGKIAFSKLIGGKWQIVVTDENGQNMINLSKNNKNDSEPSWSFDGEYIAFVSDRRGLSPNETQVYIMDADGSNQRLVTKRNEDVQDHYPCFSPDGKKLVFTRKTIGENLHLQSNFDYKIFTIDIDGKNEEHLTAGFYARWSPDGRKMIFNPFDDVIGLIQNNVATMDTDGKNQVNITDGADIEPSWSRNGKYIVFSSPRNGNSYEIYKMDSDGKNIVCLTNGGASWLPLGPSWSPDGKQIVFWNKIGNSTVPSMYKIYKVSVDGGNPIPITEGGCRDPSWFDPAFISINPAGKLVSTWSAIKIYRD